jgi:hypothetical protein
LRATGLLKARSRQRTDVTHVLATLWVGENTAPRRPCPRNPNGRSDVTALTADIIALASQYGRHGYRRITAMLHGRGAVNVKRVERIWRRPLAVC